MQGQFIGERRFDRLVLFFNGWGMDATPFDAVRPGKEDLLTVFDYRTPDLDPELLSRYRAIRVVAWSMGVWAAERFLACHPALRVTDRTAVNGTSYPVDAAKGIHPEVFRKTLEGMNEASLDKFRLRMCGSARALREFNEGRPARNVTELIEELAVIGRECHVANRPAERTMNWDTAVIGTADRIFLPEQQRAGWKECAARIVETPVDHYSKPLLEQLLTTGTIDGNPGTNR